MKPSRSYTVTEKTHLKSYPVPGCRTSGAILQNKSSSCLDRHVEHEKTCIETIIDRKWLKGCLYAHQHGVPTKVFLDRCLSPLSNMHAETPKSPSFTAPLVSSNIFPAWDEKSGRETTNIRIWGSKTREHRF